MLATIPITDNLTLFRILYLVHILTVIGAFGPLFLYQRLRAAGQLDKIAALHMRFVFPSLVVLWVAGMGMAGVAKISLGGTHWITLTILLWVIALAVSWFLIRPAMTDTSEEAGKKLSMGVGITHLILVLALWLMIFKPFVDGTYKINN